MTGDLREVVLLDVTPHSIRIRISFLMDADGILSMEALERRTGPVSRWVIQSPVLGR